LRDSLIEILLVRLLSHAVQEGFEVFVLVRTAFIGPILWYLPVVLSDQSCVLELILRLTDAFHTDAALTKSMTQGTCE
jgi:hypothetical protein